MNTTIPTLEAVYYGSPIPRGKAQLTALALVFDRIHFPNVSLPFEDVDLEAVKAEVSRIEAAKLPDYETALLCGILRTLPHVKDLREFCTFTGTFENIFGGETDPRVTSLVEALEEEMFGPSPAGVMPMRMPAFHKGIPGTDSETSITYAGTLFYPAGAAVYAAEHGLPLVNDGDFPVPAINGESLKNNTKLLASILAMECVSLALPTIPSLTPQQIVELRAELKGTLQPFRSSLLRLANQLNQGISQNASNEDVMAQARFLVETEVQATLEDLKSSLLKPTKTFAGHTFEAVKHLPVISTVFATMGSSSALAYAFAAAGAMLIEYKKDSGATAVARSPMYYLLKLQQIAGK